MKTLNRLLIANRGEIAVRIARTARRLGLTTIGVYSDADRGSAHAAACDTQVAIGGLTAADSYLRIDKIISAAKSSRAHAVHPGYGFLSENSKFAEAVLAEGMIFVGPPPSAIYAMGDKARAKRLVASAGIAAIPGYDGDQQDESHLLAEAERIGMPLMVKAAAGGGGRGMRLVTTFAELPDALRSAVSEATKAFGDGRVILERAVSAPRHIEIQVLADAQGHVIHLGERDCSIQRRHQKIVEESPSPALDPLLRERMGAAAIAVARTIGYVGAGTVEFLLDGAGDFFFMEMNARLQVEHPVTELVTGVDLVELQLRVARGESLMLAQHDVRLQGHAIEVRLCAEEPADDFLPRTGTVVDFSVVDTVRCDHAVYAGMAVTPYYDSMLAKVISHGATREEALDRLTHALDRASVLGVATNRAFLARILRHPVFAEGGAVSTGFIDHHFGSAATRVHIPDKTIWALAAWLSVAGSAEILCTPPSWRHWSNSAPWPTPWRLRWAAPQSLSHADRDTRAGRIRLGDCEALVTSVEGDALIRGSAVPAGQYCCVEIDGATTEYRYAWEGAELWLHTSAGDYAFTCSRRSASRVRDDIVSSAGEVRATINGRVIEVAVTAGTSVSIGQRIAVIEAMKMEHEVRATQPGLIAAVGVKVGDQVAPGQWLIRLEGNIACQK